MMTIDFEALAAPFDPSAVHWRVQGQPYERNGEYSAMALAYLDARDVMDRLDAVCGPANWQTAYDETPKGRLICRISVFTGGTWVTKSDGAGDTDVEGEKGAISDALKRAAVSWGIGRYLYRMGSPWVPCEVSKKGDKTYWKSWKVDPWTKVKPAPPKPAAPRQELPPFDAVAAHDRIARKLEGVRSLADLADAWKSEAQTITEITKARADLGASLTTIKDRLKGELTQKDAA